MTTAAVILAAGMGKRMRSTLPKVLHPIADLPMVGHVVALAESQRLSPIVVVVDPVNGPNVEAQLRAAFPKAEMKFAVQELPRGTGDAMRAGLSSLADFTGDVIVLAGDVPLLTKATVRKLIDALPGHDFAMLTATVPDPTGYGRVVREGGKVRIVEHRDATDEQLAINEVNVAIYMCDTDLMRKAVAGLKNDNAQGEFYLTDVVTQASKVVVVDMPDPDEMRGVNNQAELAAVDQVMRARLVKHHQLEGVRFKDPSRAYLTTRVTFGEDVVVGVDVQFGGTVKIGRGVVIEGPTVLRDCVIGDGTRIASFSHIEGATVGNNATIGPFARLRRGAELASDVHIGNYVEVKNSKVGLGSKANHFTYLGDTDVGSGANIGAGTITCNYDGTNKHRTTIGDGVFVGSNSTLVAPVRLGAQSYIAAGSTITEDVPDDALAFGRARQETREGLAKTSRERMKARKGS
ncbi:MAG: bifunctional UDP-N-acetylglucosamine diphosphorylase/glucosamine-1-phosphate N-acetyltransferase GlmU [Clostridia bacterium]|nr:bifunctional UDP-N-acetylglucosamine diphosphorylase/glucosamine-1-phosphate N-acetyltransferase GlmU [Deltaproteobacteria bacterium]